VLSQFVINAHPERSFVARCPPGEKLLNYTYTANGCSGIFQIYRDEPNHYYAKMIQWTQYQGNGPGDIYFWRDKQAHRKVFSWAILIPAAVLVLIYRLWKVL